MTRAAETSSGAEDEACDYVSKLWRSLAECIDNEASMRNLACHRANAGRNMSIKVQTEERHVLTLCRTPSTIELWVHVEDSGRQKKLVGLTPGIWRGWHSMKISHTTDLEATRGILLEALASSSSLNS
ncbi:MAG: hypothetical protein ACE5PO_01815 [Candidatus Bathyarchaeia archaeon]